MMYRLLLFSLLCLQACNPFSGDKQSDVEAILIGTRVNTPKGRMYYMGAYAGVPIQADPKDMYLLGNNVAMYSYGRSPYVWDGARGQLTKYEVDVRYKIQATDSIAFAGIASSASFGAVAFVSDEEAYVFFLADGKVVAFNPSTMEIGEEIEVERLPLGEDIEVSTNTYYAFLGSDGRILLPIGANPGAIGKFVDQAQVAVFNTKTKKVGYSNDSRMTIGYNNLAKDFANGDLYYRPSKYVARIQDYRPEQKDAVSGGLLRVRKDGTFDPDFFVDLQKVLNARRIISVIAIQGKDVLVQYIDKDWKMPENPGQWFSCSTRLAMVDVEALTFKLVSSLDRYGTIYPVGEVDGRPYYANFGTEDGKYHFLVQDNTTILNTKIEAIGGSGIYIARLK
ncbi:DUF4374 domain-containing protein [Sphingobacterium yanglingense]|uniref:DUF4374 domain-containing protein n=1 Tax=Sphingobacterium yanglingense TaxID=1437280 RepID=A0A4R6WAC1_9SPHI|nr:DUF4374 domain-containing protein [Sphingobacterium yanglingense]TDQ76319.1 hypothetical protein CLV99_2906 [Sphingobacterium yanglingense]